MSKLEKRVGYTGGLVASNPHLQGTITTITGTGGTGNILINPGTTITTSPYVSSGSVYNLDISAWEIEYESLAPIAVNHRLYNKRLIVWEP